MHENPIIKHSNLELLYNRVFEPLNVLFKGFRAIEVFYNMVCKHLTTFWKRNRVFYNRVFMHMHSRDESLSQIFKIGYTPYTLRITLIFTNSFMLLNK